MTDQDTKAEGCKGPARQQLARSDEWAGIVVSCDACGASLSWSTDMATRDEKPVSKLQFYAQRREFYEAHGKRLIVVDPEAVPEDVRKES